MKKVMYRYGLFIVTILIVCYSFTNYHSAESKDTNTATTRIVLKGLNIPWEILWSKDDHIWMTERKGKISKIDPATGKVVFSTVLSNVVNNNEGGMLGMVQHPDFLKNGLFYVVYDYNNANGDYREKMLQMKFDNDKVSSVKTIIDNIPASSIHNGSRLWITAEATPHLFMTTGDASNQSTPQNTALLSGKVLRFNLDGSIPADNPIAGSAVWSYGHRNPQGMVVVNGIMYASEHGPDVEDEVNIIEKNRNYGWPTVKGPCNESGEKTFCAANNVKEPIWSSGSSTLAVCGLDYYNSSLIPELKNSLLMCTLKDASLRVLTLSKEGLSVVSQKTLFKNEFGRLRDICISPAGKIYLCTSNGGNDDELIEISKL